MKRAIIGISDGLDTVCRTSASLSILAMLVFVSIQVVARYLLQSPPTWTEELARYAMVWAGLLGATVAFKARFDPTLFKPPEGASALISGGAALIRTLAVVVWLAPVLYYSLFGPGMNLDRGFVGRSMYRTADTLGFPMAWVAVAVPIAAGVIFVHLASRLAGDRTGVLPPSED